MPKQPDMAAILADLAPGGRLRFALNHGNVVLVRRGVTDDTPTGISVDLARELARRLGAAPIFVHYDRAGDVTASASRDEWDVCFLAIDPLRAREIAFTEPYVAIEGNFLVPQDLLAATVADVDRASVKVGVTKGSAYALYLLREAKGAEIVEFPTNADATAALVSGKVDAIAGVRQAMEQFAAAHTGYRLVAEPFMSIRQAMGAKAGRPLAAAYLQSFVAEMKRSGFVAASLARNGQAHVTIP